jgi:hypothetical protein
LNNNKKENDSKLLILLSCQIDAHFVGSNQGTKCMRHFIFVLFSISLNDTFLLMDNEFILFFLCVKFDFHLEQSNERMIMKCTNLISPDNQNSDDENQDSKKKSKARVLFFVLTILANEMIIKNEQNDHQQR